MSRFAERPKEEREVFILEAAARIGVMPVIVEKDYWVCWLLGRIFADPKWEPHLIFKGGTSLSQVFNLKETKSRACNPIKQRLRMGFAIG